MHSDGSLVNTDKATLLNKQESLQTETTTHLPDNYTHVYDGGLLLHSVLSQTHCGTSYASIARTILSVLCSNRGTAVHICVDQYKINSIKDSERKLRGASNHTYSITGSEQTIRQSGKKMVSSIFLKMVSSSMNSGSSSYENGRRIIIGSSYKERHWSFPLVGSASSMYQMGASRQSQSPNHPATKETMKKPILKLHFMLTT